jgi:hypothetical protein
VLAGLLPGDVPTVRIPVVNAGGAAQGAREIVCIGAGLDGEAACNGSVTEAGIFAQLGGRVEVRVLRGGVPLLPPLVLPPPPPPLALLPLPAGPAIPPFAAGAVAPEVPVIPEADTVALLLAGLLTLGALAGRRLQRRDP